MNPNTKNFAGLLSLIMLTAASVVVFLEPANANEDRLSESDWSIQIGTEPVDLENKDFLRVVLRFTIDGVRKDYAPSQPPYSMMDHKVIRFDGKKYFVTFWFGGAASTHIRIFEPSSNGPIPLCEFKNIPDESELKRPYFRRFGSNLHVRQELKFGAPPNWIRCSETN